jgi:hypothetical protein
MAVASALSIEQEDRPADAVLFGEALRGGAAGIKPFRTGATRMRTPPPALDDDSREATQVISGRRGTPTGATRLAPTPAPAANRTERTTAVPPRRRQLEPQRPAGAPTGAYARREPAYPDRRGGSGRGFRRLIGLLALLCVLAAAVVVAVSIATSTSPEAVKIQHVVSRDAKTAINELRSLIGQNTSTTGH